MRPRIGPKRRRVKGLLASLVGLFYEVRDNLGQIVTTMAKQYDAAVGPWKAHLGILTR
jgi:hypothetical protein